jgi:hypothetical protein
VALGLVKRRGSEGPAAHLVGLHGRLEEESFLEGVPTHHYDVLSQSRADWRDLPLLRGGGEGWMRPIGVTRLLLKRGDHRRPEV